MPVSQTAHFGTSDCRQRASKHVQCTRAHTHTRPGMKIAYTKMVFRGGWLMLRELEPPRYDSASWLCSVFFPSFVLLYPISLTLGYSRPAVVHAENEILMTPVLSAHRSELRCVQRKSCADEKEIASSAHNLRIFIKYDWFLLAYPRSFKYIFSTSRASIFQSSGTSETIVFNIPRVSLY